MSPARARTAVDTAEGAIVFTDLAGFTEFTAIQGDEAALDLLGVQDQVVSPTFTLVREYEGRLHLAHVDVYRLDRLQEVVDLGLEELGGGDAVLVVEWGDAIEALLPADRLSIELTTTDGSGRLEDRRIVVEAGGGSWVSRWERLESLLAPWGAAA